MRIATRNNIAGVLRSMSTAEARDYWKEIEKNNAKRGLDNNDQNIVNVDIVPDQKMKEKTKSKKGWRI